jgi:hypothetical protein
MDSSNCQFAGDDGKPLPLDQEVGVARVPDKIIKIVDINGYHAILVDSIMMYYV